MHYKITDIEGIGETYGQRLIEAGIQTTADLLEHCATKHGREKIAAQCHLPEKLVLTWVNHADLMRIKGIAGQMSELLEAAGVDSVPELKHRNPENLHAKLLQVNDQFGLTGKVPSVQELEAMIAQAKELPPVVKH
jgi:predicted flap endonuclease-1-like 5' DNA nuclease